MINYSANDTSPLLSVREAASLLGISTFTLHRYCRLGEMAHYRIFGRIKFSRQQIEEFKIKSKKELESDVRSSVTTRSNPNPYLAIFQHGKH